MTIGKVIKEYREKNHLTMQDFADKVGLSKGYISMLERGVHPQNGKEIIPSIATVNKIATAMNISIDALLETTDPLQKINVCNSDGKVAKPDASSAAEAFDNIEGTDSSAAEIVIHLSSDDLLVKVRDNLMAPTILQGDIVIVSKQELSECNDRICLVKIGNDEPSLKRINMKEEGITIICDNVNEYSPHFYVTKEVNRIPISVIGVAEKLIRQFACQDGNESDSQCFSAAFTKV